MTELLSDTIRDELAMNGRALCEARKDAELFARLSKAAGEVTRLQKEGDKLTARLNDALAAEAKAERAAFAATIRNLRVGRVAHDQRPGVLYDTFNITYEQYRWCRDSNEWMPAAVASFASLPDRVLTYIITDKPALIPEDIKAFVPGDVAAAVGEYLAAQRRGYTR